MSQDNVRINQMIRAKEVRVIDVDGAQIGIMPIREALRLAEEKNLDLVEVAPNANPPVCRIMDFGKFRYEQSKRERENRKKQRVIDVKEIRFSPKIDTHDFQVKVKSAQKFLKDGDKVKVTVRFRGREIIHNELAKDLLLQLAKSVEDIAVIERVPKMEGRSLVMILAPKPS
ncbi:MAG: translation initiation factor IF-3 [Firmicutes bacterium]|nr:translation initiation factor IF-3 [Bacillota bacterium]